MLPRRNGLFLQSPLKILSVLVFHVLLKHSCGGQSQLIGPSQPIVAKVGEDVILPCHLEPAVDVVDMTLEWKRPDLDPMFALVRRAGQDLVHIKNPSYTDRTSVFVDKLKHGNISLKLSKVQPSDEGTYQCYIPKLDKEAFVKLVVGQSQLIGPSQPIVAKVGEDVILPCHLEPAVDVVDMTLEWKRPDLDPMFALVRRAGQDLVHIKNPSYTDRTSVFVDKLKHGNISLKLSKVQPSDEGTYQCYIPTLDKEAFVKLVVDEFQPDSTNTVGLIVGLSICILVILILALFVWRLKRTKSERRNRDGAGKVSEEEPLRTNEKVNKLTADVEKITEEKQSVEDERKKLQTELKTTRTKLNKEKQEGARKLKELKTHLEAELTEHVEKLTEEKQRVESERQNLQKELETTRTKVDGLTAQVSQLTKEKQDSEDRIKQLTEEDQNIEHLQSEVSRLTAEVKELKEEKQKNDPDTMNQELDTSKNGALKKSQKDETGTVSLSSTTEPFIEVEYSQGGTYVRLKNTSGEQQELNGWKLEMRINNKEPFIHIFKDSLKLGSKDTFTIKSRIYRRDPTVLEWKDLEAWKYGDKVQVTLISNTQEVQHLSVHRH